MDRISTKATSAGIEYPIEGFCDPRFAGVLDRFRANFAEGLETGACVAVTIDNTPAVDLWGGYADTAHRRPWQRDTIVGMHSVSKAIAATVTYILVDRGLLDPDKPVAAYWPEFAANGKENLPLRYVLDHRAGLPYVTEPLPRGSAYEPGVVAAAIARMRPLWEPGTQAGYHVVTQGFIEGELVKRVTGQTLGAFLRREVCEPLGIDYHFGLHADEVARCADQTVPPDNPVKKALANPDSDEGRFWRPYAADEDFNSLRYRTAEIPSDNGHGNARAVARLLGAIACGGSLDGVRLMSQTTRDRMIAEQHNMEEQFLKRHYHQGSGVVLNSPPVSYMGPNPRAFGHHGVGGSIGFGDPDARIGFAYGVSKLSAMGILGARRDGLVDAVFAAL